MIAWATSSSANASNVVRGLLLSVACLMVVVAGPAIAQATSRVSGHVSGQVTDSRTGSPLPFTTVFVEGTNIASIADSMGFYRLNAVPAGLQVIRAQRIGYAPTRVNRVILEGASSVVDLIMARHALELRGVEVTADPTGRARGELGTATVIEKDAIKSQTAASIAGVLELLPGVVIQPPGLDNVQQLSLRAVPVSAGSGGGDRSAETLASFGTLVILDGVPLSNDANLQSLGARAELNFSTSAGGGIDLRRIPASTLERVEVLRGIPSARYGNLTQGAIIIDTRAGAIAPEAAVRVDERTTEVSVVGGRHLGTNNTVAITTDVAQTGVSQLSEDSRATRISWQLAHRLSVGSHAETSDYAGPSRQAKAVMDTKIDFYRLVDDRPERPALPGLSSRTTDAGARLSERIRLILRDELRIDITSALDLQRQQSLATANLIRGATPVTTCTIPCRAVGRYLGGAYNSRAEVHGAPSTFYTRAELSNISSGFGFLHSWRLGSEIRREGNSGRGYQFDIEFPPQVQFNGVRGFARPRSFDAIPAMASTSVYVDDRLSRSLGSTLFNLQAGLRLDVLHQSGSWLSGNRDAVVQPRLNFEVTPASWISFRGGFGRLAKAPTISDLYPAPEYYDVINVNFFANNPAERLAVLTTSISDPTNPAIAYSVADNTEAGIELRSVSGGASLSVTGFRNRITGAIGITPEAAFLLREHFSLLNTAPGSGRPPMLVEPAVSTDSVPLVIERPDNNTREWNRGVEITATLPELSLLKTRFEFQGAWVASRVIREAIEFSGSFNAFQISENQSRSPYFNPILRTGERMLLTTRIIHHQPTAGLVITGTVQHTLRELRRNRGAVDTLSFVGYITRGGSLVPVAPADRGRPELTDVRLSRPGVFLNRQETGADWIASFQVSKTLPLGGTLSFYAFNAFDKSGTLGSLSVSPRLYSPTRFGLELTMPLAGFSSP